LRARRFATARRWVDFFSLVLPFVFLTFVEVLMEILAILAAVLAAVVFVAERLAVAIMMYMLVSWTWRATAAPRALLARGLRWLNREVMILVGQLKWVREAVQFYWMARTLRRQFAMGATP